MTEPTRSSSYRFGTFELQPNERRLLAGGEPVVLGPRAFDLLIALVERPGQLVTKVELLDCVWPKLVVEENNLQVQVSALRKILGQEAIATIPGRGYRFTVTLTGSNAAGSSLVSSLDQNVPSIAVLPFVNMSDDAANEYFADGGAEAQRGGDPRRQRTQGRQTRADHRAARPGGHRLASVVGDIRPGAGGHLRGAGRNRAVGGERAAIGALGREGGFASKRRGEGGSAGRHQGAR